MPSLTKLLQNNKKWCSFYIHRVDLRRHRRHLEKNRISGFYIFIRRLYDVNVLPCSYDSLYCIITKFSFLLLYSDYKTECSSAYLIQFI